jgi:mitochondrial import receptor subunit TOM70
MFLELMLMRFFLYRQVDLARTENELATTLTYRYATQAQMRFLKEYPEMAPQLPGIASAMQ